MAERRLSGVAGEQVQALRDDDVDAGQRQHLRVVAADGGGRRQARRRLHSCDTQTQMPQEGPAWLHPPQGVRPKRTIGTQEQHEDDELKPKIPLADETGAAAHQIFGYAVGEAATRMPTGCSRPPTMAAANALRPIRKSMWLPTPISEADQDFADGRDMLERGIGEPDHAIDVNTDGERSLAIKCRGAERPTDMAPP